MRVSVDDGLDADAGPVARCPMAPLDRDSILDIRDCVEPAHISLWLSKHGLVKNRQGTR